ncbi:MAG: SRPBCC family protein [Bacteroidota bacterium]
MQKINFSANINAPREKVWEVLWDLDAYQTWTKAFAEGSTVTTDNWKEGSKVLFHDGNGAGMVSEVAANRPNEYMSFRHLGMVKDGVEDTSSDEVKNWAGILESYTLKDENGITELSIDMDIAEEYKTMFDTMWPNALAILKGLAEGTAKTTITIAAEVNAPAEKVWKCWTTPEHITKWNNASDDWHCPKASNDIRPGGSFSYTMAAKDRSFSFDFAGSIDEVKENEYIHATMGDGRLWRTWFKANGNTTKVIESFEAENIHPLEMQRFGWQSILNSFKKHTETNS